MNLLRVQDALKDASDQQLMQMMQAPDSTAPSYLVLSEIRRRRDMRAQQPPEGQSNRTVAEELLSQDDGGIRNIVAHDEPEAQEGADEMAAGGLASLRRYREGGVVRMQAGGQPPSPYMSEDTGIEYPFAVGSQDPVIFGRPLHSYSLEELQRLRADERAGVTRARGSQFEQPSIPMGAIERRIATLRGRTEQRIPEPEAFRGPAAPPVPGSFGGEAGFGEQFELPRVPERVAPTTPTQPQNQQQPPAATTTTTPTQPQGQQQPPPATRTTQPAQGIGTLRPGNTEGAEANPPNVQFTDRLSPLFERMREGRVDPAARRNEALNMALIEAGLRIASSRNPSLAGALGEGATPAVQSYAQQLGQIRTDQRQDLRDELQGALAQNQNDYYRGRLSQQEFATRQQMIIERLRQSGETGRTMLREAGADARNAATVAAQNRSPEAQRLWEFMHPGQTFDPNNAAHVESMNRVLGRGRDPNEAREQRLANALQRDPEIASLSRALETASILTGEAGVARRALIREQLDAARRRVEQTIGTGSLPVSNTPTGPGPVVQAPPR